MKQPDSSSLRVKDNVIPGQVKVEFVIQKWIEDYLADLEASHDGKYAKKVEGTINVPTDAPLLYSETATQEIIDALNQIKQALVDAGITS